MMPSRRIVRGAGQGMEGMSCLAVGADQHFAQVVLDEGLPSYSGDPIRRLRT